MFEKIKFRKGEEKFYMGYTATELAEYVKIFPQNSDQVKLFVEKYRYNWKEKKWIKNENKDK